MSKFEELKSAISQVETDYKKISEKGNASAGTRVRKQMQEIKKICNDIRAEVQELKAKD
jgi:archaellum component FlaC